MITIKTDKETKLFNLSDKDEELISKLCSRLESLWDRETEDIE